MSKCLRTKIRESMIEVYGKELKEGGKASNMADAVYKRVQRHIAQQFNIRKST